MSGRLIVLLAAVSAAVIVILMQYLRAEPRLLRTVTILKSRASAHEPEIREFDITPGGIVLGDPIVSEQVSR